MLTLVHSTARAAQAQVIERADAEHAARNAVPLLLHPLSMQSLIERATVYPWIVQFTYSTTQRVGMFGLRVVQAPMHAPPHAENFIPEGAELLREDIFPASRFEDMTQGRRERYRSHYRAFLMWRKAHALGKTVEDLSPWVDYDAALIDETVERWVHRGVRFAGD
jgi:hypothetical protein